MTYFRVATLLILVLVITACGRRLPEEYFEVNSDFVADTVQSTPTSVAIAPTATLAPVEMDSTEDTDTNVDVVVNEQPTEPQFELVEVPVDPIVEQVANADPVNGETLLGMGVPCTSCHNFNSEDMLVGPGMLNIPIRAENRIEGVVAERYLYNSIVHPNDYIVDGFSQGVMPQVYTDILTEDDLLDVVAYLMTLGDYPEREPSFIEVPIETDEIADNTDEMVDFEPTSDPVETDNGDTDTNETSDTDGEIVYIVVTATPMPDSDNDAVENVSEPEVTTEEANSEDISTETIVIAPNYDIDISDSPANVDFLVNRGIAERGEAVFEEVLINGLSCSTCHSVDGQPTSSQLDLSTIGIVDNASAYVWAAIFNNQLHPALGTQYQQELSGSETAHLVAYLLSLSANE